MSSLILGKAWHYSKMDQRLVAHLAEKASIPEVVARILAIRGINTPEAVSDFLDPSLSSLSDPWKMADMDKAVDRLVETVNKKEKVAVFGDYDADGVTATAVLYQFLSELHLDPMVHIPHREHEGYGLNAEAIKKLASKGCTLLITVDCGISGHEEVELARDMGIDVIVTDHHEVSQPLPKALAVINPKRPDCDFPFKGLAGVGVAFNLVRALRARLYRMGFWKNEEVPNLKEYLDLVAIGTIADVMPLHGDNRILTRAGLEVLDRGQRPGIYALKMISRIGSPVTTEDICYRISPRINAAGRMDHAYEAFRLLVEDNETRAFNLAQGLQRLNQDRQNEEAEILKDAKNIISSMGDRESYVLFNPEWKKGIVGIVAGKLSEQLSKPVILFALDGDYVHGSGRSPDAFNLYEILSECSSFLDSFGGHRVAAGVHLKVKNLKDFSQAFEAHVSERAKDIDPTRGITLDFPTQLSEILDPAFQEFYGLLEPFGQGFRAPLLAINDYSLCSASVVGKGHLKLILSETFSANDRIELIGWGHGDKVGYMWDDMEIACVPLINEWSGRKRLELRLKDARYREGNL